MVKEKDSEAKVYAAGGVVRSLLGFIYKKLYSAHHKEPLETTEQVLNRIIRGEKRNGEPKAEILSLSALGVGSDLDILIEPSPSKKDMEESIKNEVKDLINSAESASGLRNVRSKLKYAVVPIGDVKNYRDQIARATEQGGSTLDWLAFPLTRASGEGMRHPDGKPDILEKFLEGSLDYLPAQNPSALRDPDKQTIRGLRPLLEIPFLHLSPSGNDQMKHELEILLAKVRRGALLSTDAYSQFEKMVRNARFEGAHNRFYSFDPSDSPQVDREIDSLVYQLSETSQKGEKNLPLIPEFLTNSNVKHRRTEDDKCGLKASGLLMDPDEFIREHTNGGHLYHGTPRLDNILSVIRNGFIVSSDKQGNALMGRGAYFTKDKSTAQGYGSLLDFTVKEGASLRVIDLNKIQSTDKIDKLRQEAQKLDFFKYLSEQCDVDFIVNKYVLIQNSGAINLPKNAKDIIKLYESKLPNSFSFTGNLETAEAINILGHIVEYSGFYHLGKIIGLTGLRDPYGSEIQNFIINSLKNPDPGVRRAAVTSIMKIKPSDPQTLNSIVELLKNSDIDVRFSAAEVLGQIKPSDPQTLNSIVELLKNSDIDVRFSAAKALGQIKPSDSQTLNSIVELFKNSDSDVHLSAAHALGEIKPRDPETLNSIVGLLKNSNRNFRSLAAYALGQIKPNDLAIHQALAHALGDSELGVRYSAAVALGQIKPNDLAIHQALAHALGDSDVGVRYAAAEALGRIKPMDPAIHQALAHALGDSDGGVRRLASNVLMSIYPSKEEALEACIGGYLPPILSETKIKEVLKILELVKK